MNDPNAKKTDASHVLLVSKDPGVLGSLKAGLEERGLVATEAKAPSAALSTLAGGDGIVWSWSMPMGFRGRLRR